MSEVTDTEIKTVFLIFLLCTAIEVAILAAFHRFTTMGLFFLFTAYITMEVFFATIAYGDFNARRKRISMPDLSFAERAY